MASLSDDNSAQLSFLRSRTGKSWLLLLGLILLSSIAGGSALYRSNVHWFETNKSEETDTALRLVEAMVANYTDIRTRVLGDEAPVPAEFRAHSIEGFNAARDGDHVLNIDWLGVPGREIATAPADPATARAIVEAAQTGHPESRSEWLALDSGRVFRTLAPSVASQAACVDCHNLYLDGRPPWQLGDIMGAFVIDVPAEAFLTAARQDAILSGSVLFIVLTVVSGVILFLQHQRHLAEIVATASRERERAAFEGRQSAETANRAKSRFLALMSHELRTPLNAILGFSEVMVRQTVGPIPPRYADYAQDIHNSGQHLLTVINDILDIARAESGHLRLAEQDITLAEMVQPCLRLIAPRVEQENITLSARLPEGVRLHADPTKLRQTILNLLSNAVKFTPEGGRIDIDATLRDDGGLAIQIADTGIGINPEDIPQALTPFERLEASEQIEGTGLGLPLAKVLAELHGGALKLESAPGAGTRATVYLPAQRVHKESGPVTAGVEPGLAAMPER